MTSNICKLCNENVADKTNSHIYSLFIIASCLTDEGKARDREIFGVNSQSSLSKFYLGRDVTPERIQELLGRQLSDSEIERNSNPFTMDHFLCTNCENRIQRLEDIVAKEVYNDIGKIENKHKDGKSYKPLSENKYYYLKYLFFSIIWRASVTKSGTFNLPINFEDRLKRMLTVNLSLNPDELKANILRSKEEIDYYPFVIFCQHDINNGEKKLNNFVNMYPYTSAPFYATINEFIICFYYKRKSLKNLPQKYFGLENLFSQSEFKAVDYSKAIRVLSEIEWNSWRDEVAKAGGKLLLLTIQNLFIQIHQGLYNQKPSHLILSGFMNKIVFDEEYSLGKYSVSHFSKVSWEYLNDLNG